MAVASVNEALVRGQWLCCVSFQNGGEGRTLEVPISS